jgi:hypothetical protein
VVTFWSFVSPFQVARNCGKMGYPEGASLSGRAIRSFDYAQDRSSQLRFTPNSQEFQLFKRACSSRNCTRFGRLTRRIGSNLNRALYS